MFGVVLTLHALAALFGISMVIFTLAWWIKVIVVGIAGGAIANAVEGA